VMKAVLLPAQILILMGVLIFPDEENLIQIP